MEIDDSLTLRRGGDTDEAVLIALHGRDSSPTVMLRRLAPLVTSMPIVALAAPIPADDSRLSRWYDIRSAEIVATSDSREITDAAAAVLAWIGEHIATDRTVALIGFSQGGVVATQALRLAPRRIKAVINLAGFTAPGLLPDDRVLADTQPPAFYGLGSDDSVVPPMLAQYTEQWLAVHTNAEVRRYAGLDHDISPEELTDVATFLAQLAR